jgi:dTDP-4-amino-4,6-dideoxygalactose transaminase
MGCARPDLPFIPMMRPRLPDWEAVGRYARQIDDNRWYSNYGPLVRLLEARLAVHFGSAGRIVVTVASATAGLAAALMELAAGRPRHCLLPSWTFCATAHAALLAGLTPVFVDVDPRTGILTPEIAEAALERHGEPAAVIAVSPFGQPVALEPWEQFRRLTGVPVLIDAAAAFDTLRPSSVPAVVSLHATKPLGCGEGGFVLSTDTDFIALVLRRSNFGFDLNRRARLSAINGKMSEYHAAVALAALDAWPDTRRALMARAERYRAALAAIQRIAMPEGWGQRWISSTLTLRIVGAVDLHRLQQSLHARRIDTRRWWEDGCHDQPAFTAFPRMPLPATRELAAASLGLPFYSDIADDGIAYISAALAAGLAHSLL